MNCWSFWKLFLNKTPSGGKSASFKIRHKKFKVKLLQSTNLQYCIYDKLNIKRKKLSSVFIIFFYNPTTFIIIFSLSGRNLVSILFFVLFSGDFRSLDSPSLNIIIYTVHAKHPSELQRFTTSLLSWFDGVIISFL